jgi:hypothetical protein
MTARRLFFLAIRRKSDGAFLPAVRGYGFTRAEPSLLEPPRLFEKPGPCRQAFNRWLEGELYEGSESDEGTITLRHVSRPDRRKGDFEIVEIELVARSLSEASLRIL